ncbi:MAG: amino acid-binding protein [Candidatus Delongbacteria bacterium]|nr:amino acid-binding protein [Candidatus Delongbacteria bacterium]
MYLPQLSIFLENHPGSLKDAVDILAKNQINIRALSLADTKDFGILRLIVDQPDKAYRVLHENQFTTTVNEVIAVEIADHPGGLAAIIEVLNHHQINIEYMYAFLEKKGDNALVVLRIENLDKAIAVLTQAGIEVLKKEMLSSI